MRLVYSIGWILIVISLSGVNYCQKDFELGAQTTLSDTPTATPDPTDDDDDGTITNTPTASPTGSVAATATRTSAATSTNSAEAALGLRQALRSLQASSGNTAKSQSGLNYPAPRARLLDGTWLGKLGDEQQIPDTKGPQDWGLLKRFEGSDDDRDGLSNSDEKRLNTDPLKADSDGDSVLDGIEILSGSNPLDPEFFPQEQDNDGLSDALEESIKTDPKSVDSDADGLRDDLEIIYGTNPLVSDSDLDSMFDGEEVSSGSDPTIKNGE